MKKKRQVEREEWEGDHLGAGWGAGPLGTFRSPGSRAHRAHRGSSARVGNRVHGSLCGLLLMCWLALKPYDFVEGLEGIIALYAWCETGSCYP